MTHKAIRKINLQMSQLRQEVKERDETQRQDRYTSDKQYRRSLWATRATVGFTVAFSGLVSWAAASGSDLGLAIFSIALFSIGAFYLLYCVWRDAELGSKSTTGASSGKVNK